MTRAASQAVLPAQTVRHEDAPAWQAEQMLKLAHSVREAVEVSKHANSGSIGLRFAGDRLEKDCSVIGLLPPIFPEWLGDRSFSEVHKTRFPYVVGEMAGGIAGPEVVVAAVRAGFLAFYGAAGLDLTRVEQGLAKIEDSLGGIRTSWGANLIHTPQEPDIEESLASLYIRRNVSCISASAFMSLTAAVVRVAVSGLRVDGSGKIHRRRFVFAKISRPETASLFLNPPPAVILDSLVSKGSITKEEARLASLIPVAEDITVEADSGGHTDNRPLVCLLPVILDLRDRIAAKHSYSRPIRIGAAGGIATPASVAAAFSMGAAYVVTGSINQSALEAETSPAVKALLAKAEVADVIMAPAADMFELGVRVQVLKRGTMFAVRAAELHRVYSQFPSIASIPANVRQRLEGEVFRTSLDDIWAECLRFWQRRDPSQIDRAAKDERHKIALIFRWYLGNASRWATAGEPTRHLDYQIWCSPAMGAFNAWASGSFLAAPANRTVVQIGLNLLEGAAAITRAQQVRACGVAVPSAAFDFRPRLFESRNSHS